MLFFSGLGYPFKHFTNHNTTFMSWNLMHLGDMLKKQGIPAYGNQRNTWDELKRGMTIPTLNKDKPKPSMI